MQRTCRNSVLLSLAISSMQLCWFDGGSQREAPRREIPRVIRLHDLRSAYLLREGVTSYDGRSAADIQAELRRHFDTVLVILEINTPRAIEVALDRLEAAHGEQWSPAERQRQRALLLASRQLQLERLRAYRNRGLFPKNEGHANHAVPIFVDNHDTACAVGHLMRLSGWKEEVAEIRATNNLVYVPDVDDSSVTEWVLTAGITLEEAALIQPAYGWMGPPPIPDDAIDITNSSMSIVFDDLRYSNFRIYTPDSDVEPPHINISVSHSFCNGIFCSIVAPFTTVDDSTHSYPVASFVDGPQSEHNFTSAVIQFDVEVMSPLHRIAALPNASSLLGYPLINSPNAISLYATEDMEQFLIHQLAEIDGGDFLSFGSKRRRVFFGSPIEPTKNLTIVTEILFREGQSHQAQLMRFDVITIPEPATIVLLSLCLAVGLHRRQLHK